MGGFNQSIDLAKQLAGKKTPSQDQQRQQDSPQTADNSQQWAEVGRETQKVFADYQADQAAGKGPNYTKLGDVAQKAFAIYNSGGGEEGNIAKIGKGITSGGGGGFEKAHSCDEAGDIAARSGEGQSTLGTNESDDGGVGRKRSQKPLDDPLGYTAVEVKTSLTSESLSGQEASYETSGLGSQTEQNVKDDAMSEKADLDEDKVLFTGSKSKKQEAPSGIDVNQGGENPRDLTSLLDSQRLTPSSIRLSDTAGKAEGKHDEGGSPE
ncbi:uncharacterized protein ColSpa_02239 [Colletotrichum spaethianum]|uniref:Uncharacterized protein n=1 Tax=Colletotrichum spaethianum TaxID=700344 RepID=A0AA37L539_9PEZI|nr:uncharacterized protein ColSpa_02239 [Colletotrichum spaethianum]GKT42058.1 hypothetical protein ColSpa_02239 [Colletotrichum spaethianum]